ncbi:TPA: MerR family transcriptional regulator [Bacillus thuringiensis]|jgi:DNA-binding transcriptional MerR regulator|uniref:MerR family transcriptional regulator n=9 Tax=Bacillus TaxID=1386 RepID=A0A9X6ZFZ4_BACCE|nr:MULTISPECIES: MerR family transcriptional regulator [Bacillus]ANN31794.1 MerR family transcriptional regulator [Bacillus thuringiensis serovar coreanensis]OUB29953.1 MerR family transcriptional regulator [Bacillus thuringiensis serovar yunnanensis]BCA36018.1 MerR family transcriptional regulator [Bacillus wiedmannii]AGE77427.1 Multidrug-efflux transporter 2 regulator [Bacillus thuringiensis serovar kurstaki str. HD73]AHX17797.1 MerR family transcriptional regulator [Bacillus bombysepticus s
MLLNKRFTIGEMAKMHNIAESTLRYYDEKGIFHPSIVDPQTNYRYYTIDQFSLLDTIKFLRQLNIPLKEIKKYIDERNPAYALNLLEKQQEMMLKKQREIEYALAKMEHRIHLIKEATKAKAEQMVIKEIPQRKITAIAVAPNTTDDMFEYYIHSLQKNMRQMDDSLFSGDIGVTVAKKGLMQNEFQAYSSVFILLDYMPFEVQSSDEIKEGMFACVYHHGPYEETDETYKKLMKYIDQEGYEISGDAIEIALIDWSVTEDPEEQVTEIQIPIMKKQSNKL